MTMEQYIIVKTFLMGMALVGAFSLFAIRVRRLLALMKAVEGKTDLKPDRRGERIRALFTDVLGQANVRRKRGPGVAHCLIFFGFLAVQPHSLELMVQGILPFFHAADYAPGLYRGYLFAADILAFSTLAGLGYALFRRVAVKPTYLTDGPDARLILLFTSVIILSFHFINAFHLLRPPADFDYTGCFTASALLVPLFKLDAMTAAHQWAGLEIAYWVHMLTILGFLIYIPGSKLPAPAGRGAQRLFEAP